MSRMQNVRSGIVAASPERVSAPAHPTLPGPVGDQPVSREQQGWDAYRKWLARVATEQTVERARMDRSIYSWRGYHTWADKVRRSWDDGKAR